MTQVWCTVCRTPGTAEQGGILALKNCGWTEVWHSHCETCECFSFYCPAHRAEAEQAQALADNPGGR